MKTLAFPKSHRLLRPSDYSKVFDDVQIKVPHRNFLILATPNSLGHARIGLIFSKKNLRFSVERNRVKRQVRETFRHQTNLPNLDIIVLGRQGLAQVDNSALTSSLNDLWRRVKKKYHQSSAEQSAVKPQGTG